MKSLFEEMGGTYTLGADGMYYPDLGLPEEEPHYGKYGRMRLRYLKEHHKMIIRCPLSMYAENGYVCGTVLHCRHPADHLQNPYLKYLVLNCQCRKGTKYLCILCYEF